MERDDIYDFITKYRSSMIDQLQREVVDYLYEKTVLTEDEYNNIISFKTRENQIISVLDLLPNKGNDKFDIFWKYIYQWYEWIITKYDDSSDLNNEVQKILSAGGVPPLPLRHVRRHEEYIELCRRLHNLKRDEYVVVHGMRGSGKSTLVSEVLQYSQSLSLDAFQKKVFWLTVGYESSVEELAIQQKLCLRLMSAYNLQSLPLESKSAKQFLEARLKNEEFEECLLILDDVSSVSFIEALDVGCKILVTTDDKDIMHKTRKKIHYFKVFEGFKEPESLKLFSESIGSDKLPIQAKNIHDICKGFPMTISLISSQLAEHKDDVLHNTDRWDVYVEKLREKNISGAIGLFDRHKSVQVTSLYKAIGMSIDSLESSLRNLYQDFALFMDDVNIKPEVLCTLWGFNKKEVEDIMSEFEKKSLIIRTWNRQLLSYIYCVHDLLLDYLKKQLTAEQKTNLHRKLITAYQNKYGKDFIHFPRNDNYIFLYLGYHLKEAGLLEEFPRLYLDLKFIEVKILTTGPADVLFDFKKYKTYIITNNAENIKKYEDFVYFVKRIGISRFLSSSDIVQFGLCESKESSVYKLALQLQKNKKQYFEILTDAPKENSPPSVYYGREEIVAAVFESDDVAIIADSTNAIKMMDIVKNHMLARFQGHQERITSLKLMKNNKFYFLSASNDAKVHIWYKNIYTNQETNGGDKPRTPSPQLRQPYYEDVFEKARPSGESPIAVLRQHRLPITHAQFSNSGMMVVTAGLDRKVIIWNFVMEVKQSVIGYEHVGHHSIETDEIIVSCGFSDDDELVLCASATGVISLYSATDGSFMSSVSTGNDIKSMFIIPEISYEEYGQAFFKVIKQLKRTKVLILGENFFYVFGIVPQNVESCELENNVNYNSLVERKRDDNYICATVSWDGKYVGIASTNYSILICELQTGKEVLKFSESNGKVCSLSWSKSNNALLAAYENTILKIWNVQTKGVLNSTIKLRHAIFDAAWICDNGGLLVTAALDNNNDINIFYDLHINKIMRHKLSTQDEICQVCVCPIDGNIVYACKNGSVYLVVLDKWNTYNILNVNCTRVFKLKIFRKNDRLMVVISVEKMLNQYLLVCWVSNDKNMFSGQEVLHENSADAFNDCVAHVKNDLFYVVKNNHVLNIYDCETGSLKYSEEINEAISANYVKFNDISSNYTYVATGNDRSLFLRTIDGKKKVFVLDFEPKIKLKTCKFSPDEKNLVVGFSDGSLNIYNTENHAIIRKLDNVIRSPVIELIWSPIDDERVVIISDREIALCEISSNYDKLISVLYMSVDKIVYNRAFNKFVTIDSSGHLHVLKHSS